MSIVESASILRSARKCAKISVARASEIFGVSPASLKRWEAGSGTPTKEEIKKLVSLLGYGEDSTFHKSLSSRSVPDWSSTSRRTVHRPLLRLLRSRRRSLGIRLQDVSASTGISLASLHRYETGERIPDPESLKMQAEACGLNVLETDSLSSAIQNQSPILELENLGSMFLQSGSLQQFSVFRALDLAAGFQEHSDQRICDLLQMFQLIGDGESFKEVWPWLKRNLNKDSNSWNVGLQTAIYALKVIPRPERADAKRLSDLRSRVLALEPCAGQLNSALDLARICQKIGDEASASDWLEFASKAADRMNLEGTAYLVEIQRVFFELAQGKSKHSLAEIDRIRLLAPTTVHSYIAEVTLAQSAFQCRELDLFNEIRGRTQKLETGFGYGSPLYRSLCATVSSILQE